MSGRSRLHKATWRCQIPPLPAALQREGDCRWDFTQPQRDERCAAAVACVHRGAQVMQTSGQERHIFLNESVFILKLGVLQVRHPSAGNTWSTTCSSLHRITEYPRLEYPQVSPNPTSAQGSEESPLEVLENLCGCSIGGHGWGGWVGVGVGNLRAQTPLHH